MSLPEHFQTINAPFLNYCRTSSKLFAHRTTDTADNRSGGVCHDRFWPSDLPPLGRCLFLVPRCLSLVSSLVVPRLLDRQEQVKTQRSKMKIGATCDFAPLCTVILRPAKDHRRCISLRSGNKLLGWNAATPNRAPAQNHHRYGGFCSWVSPSLPFVFNHIRRI